MTKLVSIMGDSISTFDGYNPLGYWVYYCDEMCERNGLRSVDDTWWMQVIKAMGADLCVNASYSGSRVTGSIFPGATCDKRIEALRGDGCDPDAGSGNACVCNPDTILIYMGINDYLNGVPAWCNLHSRRRKGLAQYFGESYDCLLKKLTVAYPSTDIACATLMRPTMSNHEYWIFPEKCGDAVFEEYNDAIRVAAKDNDCALVDLADLDMKYETLDGTHPTAKGHATIARAWLAV